MAGESLGFWSYLKAAFGWKVPLPLLGSMPVNLMGLTVFAALGFANPGFWLLGLGLEGAYLLLLAGNARFQNLVRGMHLAGLRQNRPDSLQALLERLDRESRDRYLMLLERCRGIVSLDERPDDTGLRSEGLNQLLGIFLKLLGLRLRIRDALARTRREDIEADIKSLEKRMAAETPDSPLQRAMQGTLDIQKTRLENLGKSIENYKYTETELDRIEKQVCLISEEAAVSRDPGQWSVSFDTVVKSIQGTSSWMSTNADLFESLDVQTGSADLLGQTPLPPPLPGRRARN